MANIEGSITLNELTLAEVDSDPSISGLDLPVGSLALLGDGVSGKAWIKKGLLLTNWDEVGAGSSQPSSDIDNGIRFLRIGRWNPTVRSFSRKS
mgnify:CR=1 FL=1